MTDNGQIIWEDPPPGQVKLGVWTERLTPLLAHPGRWARVKTSAGLGAATTASQLRKGKYQVPPGRWEFTAARLDRDHTAVYARYLGPEEPPA
jgi:hypothetical protein